MRAILRKELADYFTGVRAYILVLLVIVASALALHAASQGIHAAGLPMGFIFLGLFIASEAVMPGLLNFPTIIALFFIPLMGIALGFDAINREHSSGTMSRILAQPVFRDSVINGKFLAGIVTIAIMMAATLVLVSGFGLGGAGLIASALGLPMAVGVPPPFPEEVIRLLAYLFFAIIYGAFWMGLAVLFSVLFRSVGTSLLFSLAIWLFFVLSYIFGIVPAVVQFSPNYVFLLATYVLLYPITLITQTGVAFATKPLSLEQGLLFVWPQLTGLVCLTIICFAISYVVFMRQEIRAT